jgi:hypothetical protein
MSFLNRFRKQQVSEPEPVPAPTPTPATRAKGFVPPPPRETPTPGVDPRQERLIARIQALEDEMEIVERSGDPDSPFQQRIAVLTSAIEAIDREISENLNLEPRKLPSLPATPIEQLDVQLDPVPSVSFSIGGQRFAYAEEIDWAERGNQIVRGDLIGLAIQPEPLIPSEFPQELRGELSAHLERSLFAFATELRNRAVEGEALPANATLADLAVPSPECGDWELWGGISLRCLEHESRLRELNAERTELLNERGSEIEERQRQVEELPIQRRRRNQAIADLEALQNAG